MEYAISTALPALRPPLLHPTRGTPLFNLLVVSFLPLALWRGVACSGCAPGSQGAVLDGGDSGGCGWTVGGVFQSVVSIFAGLSARGGVEMVELL